MSGSPRRPRSPTQQEERDRNRALLSSLNDRYNEFEQQSRQMHAIFQEDHALMKRELNEVAQELNSMKKTHGELTALKNELGQMDQKREEMRRSMADLQKNIGKTTGVSAEEFALLRKQLMDSGALRPPKPEVPHPEENPPVGAIELSENIFSTRLLLRLGFLQGQTEAHLQGGKDECGSSDSECIMDAAQFENVVGLQVPDVEPGSWGHFAITTGWLSVCVFTSLVQLLVLGIMLKYGLGEKQCLQSQTLWEWLLLHLSKALACIVLGGIVGKDVLGIINYWMVSELLQPTRSLEVTLTTIAQCFLCLAVIGANVVILMAMTSPADVWLNMTALQFIATLTCDMLDVAKSGTLGHSIGKTVTETNYVLTFKSEYPAWFSSTRNTVLLGIIFFVGSLASYVLITPDDMC